MSAGRPFDFSIRTPEGIDFSVPLAGVVSRMLARAIDLTILNTVFTIVTSVSFYLIPLFRDIGYAFYIIVFFLLFFGYNIFFEWRWRGQTIGKRVLRIRVMDEQGLRLQFSQIMIRNLLRLVDSLPMFYLVGGTVALFSPRGQRLGDIAGNTLVVRLRTTRE
ncbi:MAG: RDD family protein, partial [Verrucomicrobiota bacterium]